MSEKVGSTSEPHELGLRSSEQLHSKRLLTLHSVEAPPLKICKESNVFSHGLSFVQPDVSYDQLHEQLERLLMATECYDVSSITALFSSLYKCCVENHLLFKIHLVVSEHLQYIVQLMKKFKQYEKAITLEIMSVYNHSTHSKIGHMSGILTADFTKYNAGYLGSIKLLTLQCILKKQADSEDEKPLVNTFLKDSRYLFYPRNSIIKPLSILKILLHLYSKFPNLKALFGMKILEYLERFQIPFESLVKGNSKDKFVKAVVHAIPTLQPEYKEYIHTFFINCPLHKQITKDSVYSNASATVFIVNEKWMTKIEESFNFTDNLKIYQLYFHYTNYLYTYGIPLIKCHSKYLDRILETINGNIKCFQANPSLLRAVKGTVFYMGEYFLDNDDLPRVSNIVNLAFNLYVTYNSDGLLKLATNLQLQVYYKNGTSEIWSKLKKFIRCAFSMDFKIRIFAQVYNVFALQLDSSLVKCGDFVLEGCCDLFQLLPGMPLAEMTLTSPVMDCLIYSQSSDRTCSVPFHRWPVLVRMLYQCIDPRIEMSLLDVNTQIHKYECLQEYESLIKCMYCLYLEMKKRNCINLKTITDTYTRKRLSRNKEGLSIIESRFIETLVLYLDFNSNFGLVLKLYDCMSHVGHKGLSAKYALIAERNLGKSPHEISALSCCEGDSLLTRINKYETQLEKMVTEQKVKPMRDFLIEVTSKEGPTLFDVSNNTGLNKEEYIAVILFNVNLLLTNGIVMANNNHHVSAYKSLLRALTLSNSLIKQIHKPNQNLRIQLTGLILKAFSSIIEECVHMGLASSFEYFVKEYMTLTRGITDPVVQFENYYFGKLYVSLTEDTGNHFSEKDVSHLMNLEENVYAFGKHCYINSDLKSLAAKYSEVKYPVLKKWLIKLGVYVEGDMSSSNLLNRGDVDIPFNRLSFEELSKYAALVNHSFKVSDFGRFVATTYEKQCSGSDSDFSPENMFLEETCLDSDFSIEDFPANYNIVSIDVCSSSDSLILTQILNKKVSTYSLSMVRNPSKFNTFDDLFHELKRIIDVSNGTTSVEVTSCVRTKEDRKKWWETRYELDSRMHELLSNVQESWLGCFKNLFASSYIDYHLPEYKLLENEFEKAGVTCKVSVLTMVLNQTHVGDLFATNVIDKSTYCTYKKVIDANQDLISCIQKPIEHHVLIVNNKCHLVPWESLDILQGKPVSRIPSMKCLQALLKSSPHELACSPSEISMILNPNGDLPKTESRFGSLIDMCGHVLVNEKPSSQLFLSMLEDQKLFIYIGHGAGDQYVRAKSIRKSSNTSPSFLLGCSSAYMKPRGKLNGSGTIVAYLQGGAPFVVGNLWDVTDKDIDKFSLGMFEKLGLARSEDVSEKQNVAMAISSSRELCKLRYLNGAAPIVYGLPMKIWVSSNVL